MSGNNLRRPWLAKVQWEHIVYLNQALCGAKYQHGPTSDGYEKTRAMWEQEHSNAMTAFEASDLCRRAHRTAPFLFFNGNTFAAIAKDCLGEITQKLDPVKGKIFRSAVGHYVAGIIGKSEIEKVLVEVLDYPK